MNRRQLLAAGAVSPTLIGRIDVWHDEGPFQWVPNTNAGLPEGVESPMGFSDLVELPSMGPYLRYVWLDWEKDAPLPVARAWAWVSQRQQSRDAFWVSLYTESGCEDFVVTDPLAIDEDWLKFSDWTPQREAILRVVRVVVRREAGFDTAFIPAGKTESDVRAAYKAARDNH